jgi:hypothetical protein
MNLVLQDGKEKRLDASLFRLKFDKTLDLVTSDCVVLSLLWAVIYVFYSVQVLPRQTCGLFTHTIMIERYPGGREKLDETIQGGELFQTIVYNPVSFAITAVKLS